MPMLSNRPYLLRAFYQWIIDSECVPVLVLDAKNPRCKVPKDYVEGGEIVFNISPSAVRDFKITSDLTEFKASFSGVIHIISAPVGAILAIYAEENGEGIFLDGEDDNGTIEHLPLQNIAQATDDAVPQEIISANVAVKGKPSLKLVE